MSTPIRLAVFALGLAVAFGAAWGIGMTIDPVLDDTAPPPTPTPTHQGNQHDDH